MNKGCSDGSCRIIGGSCSASAIFLDAITYEALKYQLEGVHIHIFIWERLHYNANVVRMKVSASLCLLAGKAKWHDKAQQLLTSYSFFAFSGNMMPSSNELIFTSNYISSYPQYLCISLNKVGMQCWVTYLDNLCSSKSKTLQLYLPLSVKFCCLFLALQQRQQSLWQIIQVMRCKLWQGSFILLYY